MSAVVAPLQVAIYTAIKAFIVSVLGTSVPVSQGLGNRVSIPQAAPGFVYMTIIDQQRLRTNIDTWDETNPAPTGLTAEQGMKVTCQIDCYGANAADWAAMLTTLWRDDYGCLAMAPNCAPLYADEARLIPLIDSESQYTARYSITAYLQYNPVTTFPMQFADVLNVNLIDVDEAYSP